MNRCLARRAPIALATMLAISSTLFFIPASSTAQETVRREAPRDVVLGKLTVVAPPVIQIDGKAERLSPGSRIRDTRNMQVLSASLAGQTFPVVYRREPAGLVHEVWMLTDDEYRKLGGKSPTTPEGVKQFVEALALIFGARP
jgi:hypothetical protein